MYKKLVERYSRKAVMERMLQTVAKKWNIKEHEFDSLDPAIRLILEACAFEVEKLAFEVADSNKRVLEQIAKLFAPGYDRPIPASSVMYSRPSLSELKIDHQFEFEIKLDDLTASRRSDIGAAIRFTPILPHHLYDGGVKYLLYSNTLSEIEPVSFRKKVVYESGQDGALDNESFWLGIELKNDIEFVQNLVIFMDWLGTIDMDLKRNSLNGLEIYLDGKYIPYEFGFIYKEMGTFSDKELALFHEMEQNIDKIQKNYANQFISIIPEIATSDFAESSSNKWFSKKHLPAFADHIEINMGCQMLWFECRLSVVPTKRFMNQFIAYINAYPVINRAQERLTFRTNKFFNIVPIRNSDGHFLAVESVVNAEQKNYFQTPPTGANKAGQFAIQYELNRFDDRDAKIIVSQLKERLMDDVNKYNALGVPFIKSFVDDLMTLTAKLDDRLKTAGFDNVGQNPFFIIWPENPGEFVYIAYWTTLGKNGNDIPTGTKSIPFSNSYIKQDESFLLKQSWGGKNNFGEEGELFAFKQALLDRGAYLTEQRIKSLCRLYLSDHIQRIKVQKSLTVADGARSGLVRHYKVLLFAKKEIVENNEIKEKSGLLEIELNRLCGNNEQAEICFEEL